MYLKSKNLRMFFQKFCKTDCRNFKIILLSVYNVNFISVHRKIFQIFKYFKIILIRQKDINNIKNVNTRESIREKIVGKSKQTVFLQKKLYSFGFCSQ